MSYHEKWLEVPLQIDREKKKNCHSNNNKLLFNQVKDYKTNVALIVRLCECNSIQFRIVVNG